MQAIASLSWGLAEKSAGVSTVPGPVAWTNGVRNAEFSIFSNQNCFTVHTCAYSFTFVSISVSVLLPVRMSWWNCMHFSHRYLFCLCQRDESRDALCLKMFIFSIWCARRPHSVRIFPFSNIWQDIHESILPFHLHDLWDERFVYLVLVCIHTCLHTHTHIITYTHTHTHIRTPTHTHTHTHTYTIYCTYTDTEHIHIRGHRRIHIHRHRHTYTYTYR